MGIAEITKFHVTGISQDFVFGADYDGVQDSSTDPREVCFPRDGWNLSRDMIVSIEYQETNCEIDGMPPVLEGIQSVHVIREKSDPEYLLSPGSETETVDSK